MREIVLDTETTGLSPKDGHRIIEIGCVELYNHIPTGRVFHTYLNPERDVPAASTAITGLTLSFLKPHPVFLSIVDSFLEFLKDSLLVIHNAAFDMNFLNAELVRAERPPLEALRAIDTLSIARQKYPGAPASLDALCKRFKINTSSRQKHGALIDAKLLSEIYIELLGGKQRSLIQDTENEEESSINTMPDQIHTFPSRSFPPTEEEIKLHALFVRKLHFSSWNKPA